MSLLRRFSYHAQAAAAALLLAAACTRSVPAPAPEITLVQHAAGASVAVTGIGSRAANALARLPPASEEWERIFTLRVLGLDGVANATPVAGKYVVDGNTLRFTPLFPLDGGRRYQARYQGAGVLSGESPQLVETVVSPPAAAPQAPVHVTGVFPSSSEVPENQLRMYIHFWARRRCQGDDGAVHAARNRPLGMTTVAIRTLAITGGKEDRKTQ
jgi:hypothetical protein